MAAKGRNLPEGRPVARLEAGYIENMSDNQVTYGIKAAEKEDDCKRVDNYLFVKRTDKEPDEPDAERRPYNLEYISDGEVSKLSDDGGGKPKTDIVAKTDRVAFGTYALGRPRHFDKSVKEAVS